MADYVMCEITGADMAGALQIIHHHNIEIQDVIQTGELTLRFRAEASTFSELQSVLESKGNRMRQIRRIGLSPKVILILKHPVLILGITLMLFLTLWIPSRIFFIRVEGNSIVPSRYILEQAETYGLNFGAIRRDLRSEKIKNGLLDSIPTLQWVGVNTSGCVAIVSVRERSPDRNPSATAVSAIVAGQDGIIRTCTVQKGNALCTPGQAVRKGQILISGLTDCGRTILVTGAEGEIYAETHRQITANILDLARQRQSMLRQQQNICLLLGKNRINFYKDSGILDVGCVKMYSEYYITLPGGFTLPLGIGIETVRFWDTAEILVEDSFNLMQSYSHRYLLDHMSAGQILEERSVTVDSKLISDYICLEMIGQNRYEEITKEHGKNYGENS